MAIVVLWDNRDKTTVRAEFETEWTWIHLEQAIMEIDTHITSVTYTVDVIIDLEGSRIPSDFMNAAKNLLANPEPRPNEGTRIVIGANAVMRTAYTVVKKTFGNKLNGRDIVFANDLMEARAILRSMRSK